MISKKAQGLPVNVVVMLILGIILFGLGFALFTQVSSKGEESINDLSERIKTDIQSLECKGDDWICTPSYTMKNGESKTFEIFVANRDQENSKYRVELNLEEIGAEKGITNSCGNVKVLTPIMETNIKSGNSASFPFLVTANQVSKTPCSFITTAFLYDNADVQKGKTPVIIRVE